MIFGFGLQIGSLIRVKYFKIINGCGNHKCKFFPYTLYDYHDNKDMIIVYLFFVGFVFVLP